jgi:PKD repeat protein/Zn-dependent protease
VIAALCVVGQVHAASFTFSGTSYEQNPLTSAIAAQSGIPVTVFGSSTAGSYSSSDMLGQTTTDANGRYSISITYSVEFPRYTYYHLVCLDKRPDYEVYSTQSAGGTVVKQGWISFTDIAKKSGSGNNFYLRQKRTLKVTSPTSEQNWQTGTRHAVTWTQTGLAGTNVRIELKDGIKPFVLVRTVAASVPASDGSYSWLVPPDVSPGSTYSVHVTSVTDPSVLSYGWLTISAPKGIPPVADFTLSSTYGSAPLDLQITDTSTGDPTSWAWTFTGPIGAGPGPVYSRYLPVYELGPGTYTINLTVSNLYGSSSRTKTVTVTGSAPVADFSVSNISGPAPLVVQFTDTSTGNPTSWEWMFRDPGGTYTAGPINQRYLPVYTYTQPATISVTLTVRNQYGSTSMTRTVSVLPAQDKVTPPKAAFIAYAPNGTVPLTVTFADLSEGLPTSWQWDFGDGTGSREKNPVHTYTRAGIYTVSLTATNAGGGDTATRNGYITVLDVPVRAAFTAAPLRGTAPLSVRFQDSSSGEVLMWDWEFGDGGHSAERNPLYTYTRPGTYSVRLTVGSAAGNITGIRTDYIVVQPPVTTIPEEPACIEEYTGEGRIRSGPDGTLTCTARVRVTSGETTLELPAGTRALDSRGAQIPAVAISPVETSMVPPLPVEHDLRFAYRCTPEGAAFDPPISVRFAVPGEPGNGNDPADLTFLVYSDGIRGWEILPTTADTTTGTLHASLNHFSIIALAEKHPDDEPPQTIFTRIREAAGTRHVPLPLSGLIPDVYSPLSACVLSFSLIGIGALVQSRGSVWLKKIREILSKYVSFLAIGKMSEVEARKRHIRPNPAAPFLFGLSAGELAVIVVSGLVFTLAYIVKDRLQVIVVTLGVFVLMGGMAIVAHELGHRITAGRCQCGTELQFWGLGTLTMLLTAWLFGNIFAKPSRTVLEDTPALAPRQRAQIMLAGPAANLLFAALSLVLLVQGGIFALAGGVGVSINLLVGVTALLPVQPMDGKFIFRWNPLVWLVIFIPVLVAYMAIQIL